VHIFAPTGDTRDENEIKSNLEDREDPPATCKIHPLSTNGVKKLSHKDQDLIFHETRDVGRDWDAIQMFQAFFALCPGDQEVEIKVGREVYFCQLRALFFFVGFPAFCTSC